MFRNTKKELAEEVGSCPYNCEKGWLPIDGVEDQDDVLLLIPTEYAVCVCNPLYSVNEDIEL